jgi:D,D-heptose 1,7-bisphosphate phosphatase
LAKRVTKYRAVFVDRDGTLIREKHYLHKPGQVRFIKGSIEALRELRRRGFKLVMITNQSGIGRGYYTIADMHNVHKHIQSVLKKNGAAFDKIYFCPHAPDARCKCRKPALGLVKKAARALSLILKKSFAIGDHVNDFILGQRMGGKGIMVLSGHGAHEHREKIKLKQISETPDKVVKNLPAAADWIIKCGAR